MNATISAVSSNVYVAVWTIGVGTASYGLAFGSPACTASVDVTVVRGRRWGSPALSLRWVMSAGGA